MEKVEKKRRGLSVQIGGEREAKTGLKRLADGEMGERRWMGLRRLAAQDRRNKMAEEARIFFFLLTFW